VGESCELNDVRVYEHLKLSAVIEDQLDQCLQQNDVSSFLICDLGDIVKKYHQWTSVLPSVQPTYVVGCNDEATVLKTLDKLGARFSCANKNELQRVLDVGVDVSRIEFSNPVKQVSHVKYCGKLGVASIAFDSESELKKIRAHNPKAELVLQVAVGSDQHSANEWVRGCRVKSVRSLLRAACKLELPVCGVCAVLGRPIGTDSVLDQVAETMREVYDIAVEEGVTLKFIDLGNITQDWSPEACSFTEIGCSMQSLLSAALPASLGVELRAQVGGYLVTHSLTLLTSVVAKRLAPSAAHYDVAAYHYYLNDGVYGAFSRLLSDNLTFTPALYKADNYVDQQLYPSTLMGPTCDDLDVVVPACSLPQLSVGDWLIFNNMGGASAARSIQSDVCYYVIDKSHWSALSETKTTLLHCLCDPTSDEFTLCPAHFCLTALLDNNNNSENKQEEWLDI